MTFINLNDNIVQPSSRVDVNIKIIFLCLCTDIPLYSFIQVSGIKNKMRFNSFSAYPSDQKATKTSETVNLKNLDSCASDEFLYWFSGFTDAEGNFLITLDRSYIKLRFRINLHIDDIKVLETIKSRLNIGRIVSDTDTSCSYIIEDSLGIELLCNIFKNFPLHTSKKLDFESFFEAFLIRKEGKLSESDLNKILLLKNNMNSKRTVFSYNTSKSQIIINPNWFIGFLEGEGTFGIKTGSSLYFQVAQKTTSQECLNGIINYLHDLSNNTQLPENSKISPLHVTSTTNAKTNVVSIVIANIDSLYYFLLPLLDNSNMYSRKKIDFELWRMALLLKIHGYYFSIEGKNLFLDISDILNKRYSDKNSLEVETIINDITNRFELIMEKEPLFDVDLYVPHIENVRKFSKINKSENPKVVYIYTENGLIEGSPFSSFSLAHKALGLKSSSNTCNRYIDTNRWYKNKYIFSSKPIDSASKD